MPLPPLRSRRVRLAVAGLLLPMLPVATTSVVAQESATDDSRSESSDTARAGATLPNLLVTGAEGSAFAPVDGYAPTHSYTATRTDTPIREIPASVQVIPRDVIEDQAARRLEDVYRNVSGVVESGNTLNAQSEVLPFIRGFEAPAVLRNGMRATTVGSVDLVNVESVEVLKGPASILYGALEPGGVLSFTTKRPQAESRHRISQEVGSYNSYRTELDTTGPLNEAGTVLYRVNAAFTDQESFRDEMDLRRYALAPSLTWLASDSTEITFDASFTRERQPYDSGIPLDADGDPLVPDDTFFGDPTLDGRTLEDWFAGYELTHRINQTFTLSNRFQYHRSEPRNESIRHTTVSGDPGDEELGLRYQNEDRVDEEFQLVTDLTADFTTGGVDHDMLVGVDLIRQDLTFDRFREGLSSVPITSNPRVRYDNEPGPLERDFDSTTEWAALYVQDQMSLLRDGRLKLLLGGRFDSVRQEDRIDSVSTDDNDFTARAGALYELTDQLAPYASISQSFQPQGPGIEDREGNQLDPETGIQYEAGLKLNSLDQRMLATLSVFRIEKEDVAVFDSEYFDDTGEIAYFPGVDQRSQGVELDISGEITPQLSVIANFAYTDAEETANSGDPDRVGQRLGNVPERSARTWLAYEFPAGSVLEGVGLGAGVRYESERLSQFDQDIEIDDLVVVDAGAWYERPLAGGQVLKARLNVYNVLDERYVRRASNKAIAHPGQPLSAVGTVSLEF